MDSLKVIFLQASCCIIVLSTGLLSPVITAQERYNPPAFSYLLHCSGCHIEDGSGDPPEVPDLRKNLDKMLRSKKGRSFMLRVPGVTDAPINPQEMADLMNWLITEFYPELEEFRLFNAKEVIKGRESRLANPLEIRQSLLDPAEE